jgi:hypothetical protein
MNISHRGPRRADNSGSSDPHCGYCDEAIYREIRPCDFRRIYELDPSMGTTKVSAKINEGGLDPYVA